MGKSTFAGSVCELVPPAETLLIVAKPGEEKSFSYVKHGLKPELFYDMGWIPGLKRFKAGAYNKLLQRMVDLADDTTYGAVIIDPGTDVVNLIEHCILEPYGKGSFGDLGDTMGAYRSLGDMSQEFLQTASLLSSSLVKRPKWVIVPWHVQPAKEGQYVKVGPGAKEKQESSDEKAQGIEYEGVVLPMLEGRYRRKLAADVDVVVYCDLEVKKNMRTQVDEVSYFIQAAPNKDRHAKVRGAPVMQGRFPNNLKALVEAMEGAK
jgi:hypothetical protein